MLFCRNIIVNYFAPLMREPAMSLVVDEIFNTYAPLYKTLGDSSPNNMTHSQSGPLENNKVQWMNMESSKACSIKTPEDMEWRASLKAGDYIDAVCQLSTPSSSAPNKFVQAWQPAKIELVDTEGNLLVAFLKLPRSMN